MRLGFSRNVIAGFDVSINGISQAQAVDSIILALSYRSGADRFGNRHVPSSRALPVNHDLVSAAIHPNRTFAVQEVSLISRGEFCLVNAAVGGVTPVKCDGHVQNCTNSLYKNSSLYVKLLVYSYLLDTAMILIRFSPKIARASASPSPISYSARAWSSKIA